MDTKTYKTTKKDFAEFCKWVRHYMKEFGLNDWTVYFAHEEVKGGVASCSARIISRGVTFTLSTEPLVANKEELNIKETALHEVIHLLIAPVSHLVGSYTSEDEWRQADEALVCRLTSILSNK